jgi:GT2 family glycosyltransferase
MSEVDCGAVSVVVIVVNFNGGEFVGRCLECLAAQTFRDFRVVVVDNASADGSIEVLEASFPSVQFVRNAQNNGFAAANNQGLAMAADSRWVALLNPDAFAAPDWLEKMLSAANASTGFSFFGCTMRLADHPDLMDGTGDLFHVSGLSWRRDHMVAASNATTRAGEIFGPCAAAALYRRDALDEVGGFDESYFCYHEDVDLAFRLRLRGHRCLFVPDAIVDHVSSGIVGKRSDFATYHGHRNLVWTFVKNMPARLFWLYLPMHCLVNLVAIIACAARGQLGVVLRAKLDALLGLPRILRDRERVQANACADWRTIHSVMERRFSALWQRS